MKLLNKKYRIIIPVIILLIFSGCQWRQSYLFKRANNIFDSEVRVLSGRYVSWPFGGPYLIGQLPRDQVTRLLELHSKNNSAGTINKGNAELVIFLSDGYFIVRFK
jgi:hypothetical protein